MAKPVLVCVHGAYHSPKHFDPLRGSLEKSGYRCVLVSLPSTQSIDLPPATLADDTAAVRNAVIAELDQGNNVTVVAHSYGGCPANNALEGLDSVSRATRGASTAVLSIAFLCAIPQPAGSTFANAMDPEKGAFERIGERFIKVREEPGPIFSFFNDLPESEAKRWSDILRPMSWDALHGETSYAAYMDIPSFYLLCTQDNTLPFQVQQGLVQAAVATGAKIETETVNSGHSPFLSKVEETSAFVRKVAGETGI